MPNIKQIKSLFKTESTHETVRPTWDEWFMALAMVVSSRSTDKSTKHGAVLTNQKKQIIGVGYNGYPRGSDDENLPQNRPAKYDYFLHAEENCLLNSQNLLLGDHYTMYVTGIPCPRCLNQMIQAGVTTIVCGTVQSACVDSQKTELVLSIAKQHNVQLVNFEVE
jgi:dCMP deaminase